MAARKPLWLNRSLIELQLHYCLVLSNEEYAAAVREVEGPGGFVGYWLKDEHAGATCNWAKGADGVQHAIVALRIAPDAQAHEIVAQLCHEALHIFQHHCRAMGEDTPSDEFAAWSVQAITQALLHDLAKRQKGIAA
jgi:hypothetical protein